MTNLSPPNPPRKPVKKLLTSEASYALAIDAIDELGLYLFPIKPGAKYPPLLKDNLAQASNDPAQIR
jgi:hypothetical protein